MFNLSILIFFFGLFIGSFLNMLIDRLPRGEQFWSGRSHCDKCKHVLRVVDLIPVVSWVCLRGSCRYCHSPIPGRNTLVELITGALFVGSFMHSAGGTSPLLSVNFLISQFLNFSIISCFVVIFFIDFYHQLIPDGAIHIGMVASLARNVLLYGANVQLHGLHLLAGAIGYAFFYALYIGTKKKGMGYGDVKLALFMGILLGLPGIFYALYVAFLTGAIVSVMLILRGRKKFGQTIAFGPFLVFGTLITYFDLILPWWDFVH